jgi:plasmid stabilization system protein ParE
MSYQYQFHEAGQYEYEKSLLWYLSDSEKAANNFIIAIENTLTLICNHPKRWRNIYKNFRELNLKKFPFTIVYVIDENLRLVTIVSVYHHKRNPENKYIK